MRLFRVVLRLCDWGLAEAAVVHPQGGFPHLRDQKIVQVESTLEHCHDQDADVVADNLAKHLVKHSRLGLAANHVTELRLDHREHGPGITISDEQQTTTILFDKNWVLKIHKLDEGGNTAPNDTQLSLNLNDNDLYGLPGLPPTATAINLGYIEIVGDRMNPEMQLVCPDGNRPAWTIDLGAAPPPAPSVEITGGGGSDDDGGGTRVVVMRPDRKANN
jgi:hypothetical protein